MRFTLVVCAALLLPLRAQQTLAVPASIEQQGVPAIPAEFAEDLARYDNARPAVFQGWHPTQREILISTRFGETTQLHRVTEPGGARRQVTFFSERVDSGSFGQIDGSFVVALRDTAGTERYQIHRVGLSDGRAVRLTDGKSRNSAIVWSPDGRSIAFASTKGNGRDTGIYVMDPKDPSTEKLAYQADSPGWEPVGWSPDSRRLLVRRDVSINETQLHLVTIQTGAAQAIAGVGEKVRYESAVFAADGRGLFVSTDKTSEFCRLGLIDLASKKLQPFRRDLEWDVSSLRLSSNGRYLAFVVNEDGADRLMVIDTLTYRTIYRSEFQPGIIRGLEWRKNTTELGFSLSHARSPGDVYSVNAENGNLYRWTYSETGGVDPDTFVRPQLIRWKSFDGRTISGLLYLPAGRTGPRPVVIDIHGGPEGQAKAGYRNRGNYWLNELGVALILPNVRGSDGYGKTFLQLDNGFKREDSVKDIGALLDWIATQPHLDSKRVMVTGGSYGGYMTLASMVHYNDRIRCAIDVVGISNFASFLKNTEEYRRDLRRAEYGDDRDPKMRDHLETISPLNHAAKFTKPIFIVQGKNDPRVPASESEQMAAAIRKQGGTVWYVVGLDEGHGFRKKRNIDYQSAATALFMKQFLLE